MYEQIEAINWNVLDNNGGLLFGDYMLTFINDEWILMTFSDNGYGHAGKFRIYESVEQVFKKMPNATNIMLDLIEEHE